VSARQIKVLHVLHAFSAGGMENGVVNLINRSPSHIVHELCLLSKGGEFLDRLTRPVVYHEMNKRAGNDIRLIFRLRHIFRSRQFQVVHTRNWAGVDGVLAACLTPGISVIHSEHGREMSDPAGTNLRRNLARRRLAFRAKKFVAVSRDLYAWLHRTVRVPESKLVLIPNGVDTERFHAGRDIPMRRELGIGDDELVVGAVGRLDEIKNYEGLIRAAEIAGAQYGKVRLVIVGDGPRRANVQQAFRAGTFVCEPLLLGYRGDVERLYRAFDVFALNSFAEGMSNTLLEAMASSLPTICTNVGGNVELIKHQVHGILVKPGDDAAVANAIKAYLDSPDLRSAHGTKAREFVLNQFSLHRMVEQYVKLYESVA
jgi:sugar transferase (PEP-CTERM/EpsH1 system associated)